MFKAHMVVVVGKCNGKSSEHIMNIQFLDRENNDKNITLPLGKQICLKIVWGCAEILPVQLFIKAISDIFSKNA